MVVYIISHMKHQISIIIVLLAFSSSFSMKAQTLEEQLRTADSLKVHYGETDSRYLAALSKAVPIAFNEGSVDTAIELRRLHSEIIKRVFGEKSLEYAEDLWRLGNISAQKGSIYSIDPYEKVALLLNSINQERTVLFCDSQLKLYWAYRDKNDRFSALNALIELTDAAPSCVGEVWNGYAIKYIDIAYAYYLLGTDYGGLFKEYKKAIESYENCVFILEEHNLLYKFTQEYTPNNSVFSLLSTVNYLLEDYKGALKWRQKSVELTGHVKGKNSEEYIDELILLRGCYYDLEDSKNEIATQEQVVSLIRNRDNEIGIDVIDDDKYLKELDYLYNSYSLANRSQDKLEALNSLIDIYEKKGETESDIYLSYLYDLILSYHATEDYRAEYQLFDKYERIAEALRKIETAEYYHVLSNKVYVLTFLFKEDEYKKAQLQWKELTEKLYGPHSNQRLSVEAESVSHLTSLEKYTDAQEHLDYCYKLLNSGKIAFANQSDSLAIMGDLYSNEGQILTSIAPLKAEKKYLEAIDICSRLGHSTFQPLNQLGLLYYTHFRDSKKALDFFNKAKVDLLRGGHNKSISYITLLSNIAVCYQDLGMSSDAIAAFDEAEEIVKKFYGQLHPMYGIIEQNKSKFYGELLDYDTAIEYASEAADCMKSIYGEKSEKYAICLHNLSVFYGVKGEIEESKELILQAAPILEKASIPYAISSYCCLLNHYSHDTNWDDFYSLVNKCSKLINNNQLQGTDVEAMFLAEAGSCLKEKDKSEARSYLSKAIQVYETLGITRSTGYIRTLLEYYQSLVTYEFKSDSVIPSLIDAYKNLYFANVIFFNAAEREQLVSSPTYTGIKDIVFSARFDKSQDSLLYDYLLFSKGLLLETSINYAKSIYESNNNDLIEQFSRLIDLRKILSGEKAKSEEVSIEEIQVQARVLERRITTYLKENDGYNDSLNYTFQDVAEALKESEAAIEFVSYHDYSDETDYYAALVVKKDCTAPEFVRICEKSEIEKYSSISPAIMYGESLASKEAYSLIWGRIIPLLSDIKTVFYSPAGCLSILAVDQLYNGDKRFADYFKAYRVTSTRQICSPTPLVKHNSAILYGGLYYDEDDAIMLAESQSVRGENSLKTFVFRGWDSTVTRKGWEYLPGTLEEVSLISSIISNKNIRCDVYTSVKGNEESFKALSGGSCSILHLATHGFYMTESQAEKNHFYANNSLTSTFISNEVSPLKRSGLLLAGGNKAWMGEPVPDGVEDGVLTAEEISSLDLRSCDIVVLSACETGLGEITDEGVYGLQRAFKNAGVKSIIMSLWEVDDKATSLMMQSFYNNLMNGMNKRDAFDLAQETVKKKYMDPRYWAAFIMLD